ncbi:Protein EXPORTIN 1A [Camellia lanceoleosa]|uniref:Protein EXPORTIN 1A n=1 Tax=Camellia lanceoleosa TaxID=1840588 RepID=A0ACC0I6U0_9ERIC|nr:Protein EXPORTIN 1A [Camellia lanceoleosa]
MYSSYGSKGSPESVSMVEGGLEYGCHCDGLWCAMLLIMRETLIYLSHLDHKDTEKQMLKKLNKQLSGEDWTWNNLNTLCWAIGFISGSMMEEHKRFLVMVIRDLLNLHEITKGKENKALLQWISVARQKNRFGKRCSAVVGRSLYIENGSDQIVYLNILKGGNLSSPSKLRTMANKDSPH